MKTAAALRHVAFEDLGSFEPILTEAGYTIGYFDAGVDPLPEDPDLLIVLGGPIGVYEQETYPCLLGELNLLRQRLAEARPVLGICLGAQLMAHVLGARVYPGGYKEIGWSPLLLTPEGRKSCLWHLDGIPVLHWHGDTFDLPHGATLLASTDAYANQAFAFGRTALALQFHPEVRAARIEQWLIGHAGELAAARIDVPKLRAESAEKAVNLEVHGQGMLREWLAGL